MTESRVLTPEYESWAIAVAALVAHRDACRDCRVSADAYRTCDVSRPLEGEEARTWAAYRAAQIGGAG